MMDMQDGDPDERDSIIRNENTTERKTTAPLLTRMWHAVTFQKTPQYQTHQEYMAANPVTGPINKAANQAIIAVKPHIVEIGKRTGATAAYKMANRMAASLTRAASGAASYAYNSAKNMVRGKDNSPSR